MSSIDPIPQPLLEGITVPAGGSLRITTIRKALETLQIHKNYYGPAACDCLVEAGLQKYVDRFVVGDAHRFVFSVKDLGCVRVSASGGHWCVEGLLHDPNMNIIMRPVSTYEEEHLGDALYIVGRIFKLRRSWLENYTQRGSLSGAWCPKVDSFLRSGPLTRVRVFIVIKDWAHHEIQTRQLSGTAYCAPAEDPHSASAVEPPTTREEEAEMPEIKHDNSKMTAKAVHDTKTKTKTTSAALGAIDVSDMTAKDRVVAEARTVMSQLLAGGVLAVHDEAAEFFLDVAKKVIEQVPQLEGLLENENGRLVARAVVALAIHSVATQTDTLPKREAVARLCEAQFYLIGYKVAGPNLSKVRELVAPLIGVAEKLEALDPGINVAHTETGSGSESRPDVNGSNGRL